MALAPSRANVLSASISEWAVTNTDKPDTGYAVIPFIRNGKLEIKSVSTPDAQGRPVPFGYEMSATAQFPGVKTLADFIQLLDTLGGATIDHRITCIGGQVFSSYPTVNPLSPTGLGVTWELDSDKDMDGDMYCTITANRYLTPTEYTNALTSANKPTTAAIAGDTFYAFASLTRADIIPAGISEIDLGVADAGTYLDHMTNIRKATFKAKLITTKNSHQMDIGAGAIQLDFSVECMETSEAELLKWPAIVTRLNECKITFVGGRVLSLPHQLGINTDVVVEKDMTDIGYITVTGSGKILSSAWDALWS